MALTQVLLQKLQRTQFNGDMQISQRSELNRIDGPIYSLFEQARNAMTRHASKQIGSFDDNSEHSQIIGLLQNFQQEKMEFLALGKLLASLLQQQFLPTEEPFCFYILLAQEQLAEQSQLHLYCLAEEDIISTAEDLTPITTRMIVPNKVLYGLQLQLDAWQQDDHDNNYISLLASRGNKAFSDAFMRFACFTQRIDNQKQTQEFLQVVEQFSEQLPPEQSVAARNHILDYCIQQDKIGQPVYIADLSEKLNEKEPTQFADFYQQQPQAPQDTVYTHRQSLKRYMRFFGRDHSLSISFSAERVNQDIVYEPISGTLSIKKLPKTLKQQLSGFSSKSFAED